MSAEMMLDGTLCEQCGEFLDGESPGIRVTVKAVNRMVTTMGKRNRLKRPTRAEKTLMESKRLNADNWLVTGKTAAKLFLQHKQTGNQKTINV